jgi:hypothetical protein
VKFYVIHIRTLARSVKDALRSNMRMEHWQDLIPFDFVAEFRAGTKPEDAALKAARYLASCEYDRRIRLLDEPRLISYQANLNFRRQLTSAPGWSTD